MSVRQEIALLVDEAAKAAQAEGDIPPVAFPEAAIERPARPEHGDYASSLPLRLARAARLKPVTIAEAIAKLADIKYVYNRSWSDGAKVFKVVSFYLFRYVSGKIGDIKEEMRHEVAEAMWLPLDEAPKKLSYKGEREIAAKAIEWVKTNEI